LPTNVYYKTDTDADVYTSLNSSKIKTINNKYALQHFRPQPQK